MNRAIPEKDWKYLRKINRDMLNTLCYRINKQSVSIIQNPDKTEHEKYLELYTHILDSDEIVARCFNDWRRSNIEIKISQLLLENLLTEEHIQNLSDETQKLIEFYRSLQKKK